MVSVLDLPIEIILAICSLLPLADCKNTRLACRSLSHAAEVYIYRTIILYPTIKSFCRLTLISNDPRHCHYVRTLTYIGNGYLMHAQKNTLIEKLSNCKAIAGLDVDDPYASVFTRMITAGLLKEGFEIRLLGTTLASLTGLRDIQLRLNVETSDDVFCDISFRGFGAILCAANRLATQLTTLQAKVNTEVFNCTFPLFPRIQESIKHVRHLSLECHLLSKYGWRSNSHRGLATTIRNASCLSTLEITSRHYLIDLSKIFPTTNHCCSSWPSLAHLKLDGFRTLEDPLRLLLSTHAFSLKSLVLNELAFVPPLSAATFDKDGPPSTALWISLVHFLQHSLQLEKVSLMGAERIRCLGSRVYAGPDWISNACPLIKLFEEYIIHRADFPQALLDRY